MFGGYTMEYQTYIFDLDGTLLDTLHDLAASTNYALRTYGMPEHSEDDVRRFVGLSPIYTAPSLLAPSCLRASSTVSGAGFLRIFSRSPIATFTYSPKK